MAILNGNTPSASGLLDWINMEVECLLDVMVEEGQWDGCEKNKATACTMTSFKA